MTIYAVRNAHCIGRLTLIYTQKLEFYMENMSFIIASWNDNVKTSQEY